MAVRENIRVLDPNFTTDGTYYYCLLNDAQSLQVKTDDGSVAFSYPANTSIGGIINSLSWDGVYFWSLENKSGGLIIRKWAIDAFILKQITSFNLSSGGLHTYSSDDMAVEYYRLSVGNNDNGAGGYTVNMTEINISDTSMLTPGDTLTFVRRRTPTHSRYNTQYVETKVVQSIVNSTTVILTSSMNADPFSDGKGFRGPGASYNAATEPVPPDEVFVTKNIWLLNDNAPGSTSTAALYKLSASSGSNIVQYSGSQYLNIGAAGFYTEYNTAGVFPWVYNTTIDSGKRYLLFVNNSSLLFFNVDTVTIEKSLNLDNIKSNGINLWPVYDLAVSGMGSRITLCRLQKGTTTTTDVSWSSYSYEKSLLSRVVNSISVIAEPSILPADGVASASITAVVMDQYNNPAPNKIVYWADDAEGRLTPTTSVTDIFGRAYTTYISGTVEKDIKITATVADGLIT